MADIIDFNAYRDPSDMTKEELLAYLEQLREQIAALDEAEPEDRESEEYEVWGEQHEELEDLLDEAIDLLEALQ